MSYQEESGQTKSSQPVLHHAAWVITGMAAGARHEAAGLVEDGAIVVADGLIQAVGKYSHIARDFGHCHTRDHEGRVLAPALINGHCHLELSHLDLASEKEGRTSYNGDLTAWIRDLLAARSRFLQENDAAEELILGHARQTLRLMHAEGIAFVGDVGNSLASRLIGNGQGTMVYFLLELLGLTRDSESKTFARLENLQATGSPDFGCTPHAPYSTTPGLIRAMKSLADRQGQVFSIHVAESKHEVEFLQSGTGPFREFFRERGVWDGNLSIPGMRPVEYLESLGVIDSKTLCVHGVHVEQEEIKILAAKKAKVCLCPGSNRFLGVGKAPVTEYLAHGILPALGTDSKSSNRELSMWREMRLLREDHPGLAPSSVFTMATRGGAEAWGLATELGTLEPGKRALVLEINCRDNMRSAREVLEYLTTGVEPVATGWLE
jgi:cytosine/adenosine deaminase-related metal-dependent hydrolase